MQQGSYTHTGLEFEQHPQTKAIKVSHAEANEAVVAGKENLLGRGVYDDPDVREWADVVGNISGGKEAWMHLTLGISLCVLAVRFKEGKGFLYVLA